MAGRNELVYDEDDYVPAGSTSPKPGRRRMQVGVVLVVVVSLVIGVFAVSYIMSSRVRSRDAEIMRARAEQEAQIEARRSDALRSIGDPGGEDPNAGWKRIQGIWSRTPGPDEATGIPIRFEFYAGRSATVTFGDNRTLEMQIAIRSEERDSVVVEAVPLVSDPMARVTYRRFYHFTFEPDGTLALDRDKGGPVFAPLTPPERPARSGSR